MTKTTASTNEKIECRYCGSKLSRVVEVQVHPVTWNGVERTIIRRWRQCTHCRLRYATIETHENEEHPMVPEVPVEFNNLKVVEQTAPRSPFDSVQAPLPSRGDSVTELAYKSLGIFPKEEVPPPTSSQHGPLRGPEPDDSLGKLPAQRKARSR